MLTNRTPWPGAGIALLVATMTVAACGGSESADESTTPASATEPVPAAEPEPATATATEPVPATGAVPASDAVASTEDSSAEAASTYQIDVWADNWMAVYVDGQLIGEDSVPITTERSFNAESFTFETTAPFTVAIEAKDFKQTDSGIEYIGQQNQQMGDGGIIAQVTNLSTGEVVAATGSDWSALVVHQAPLNTDCERDPDPDSTCDYLIVDTPADWTAVDFDDSAWASATVWSAADVAPKDGYDEISWDASAELIWGTDLEVDNTVLLRATVSLEQSAATTG